MKKIMVLLFGIIFSGILFSQSAQDTKDFIREKVNANDPIPSYDNFVFYFGNILKSDADYYAGKTLTNDEFKHLFIYGRECHVDDDHTSNTWLIVAECIDVRDIIKVTMTRHTGKQKIYGIKVYLSGKYYSKMYVNDIINRKGVKWEYLPYMHILLGDNAEAASKIKKALIYLGQIYGNTVKDGDIF